MTIGVAVAGAGICPPIGGCAAVESLGGSLTADASRSVFSALSEWLASGGVALVDHVLGLLTGKTTTFPASAGGKASWFAGEEHFMLGLMVLVILPLLLVATVSAIARQDLSRLGRTWLVALPVSVVASLVGVEVTSGALAVTNSLSSAVLRTVNVSKAIGSALGSIVSHDGGDIAGGSVAVLFIASLAIVAGILLWLELVVRSAAIYVALLFLPLALSGIVWPSTSHMARRLVQMLVALIVSKFVVAAVLALGARAVAGGAGEGALAGVAILLLAGFAPFVLLRMVPIVEAAALGHLEGLSRRPFEGGRRAMSLAASGANMVPEPIRAALGFNAGRGGSTTGGGAVSAGAVGSQPGAYGNGDRGNADPATSSRPSAGPVASPRPTGGVDGWGEPARPPSTAERAGATARAGAGSGAGHAPVATPGSAPGYGAGEGEDR